MKQCYRHGFVARKTRLLRFTTTDPDKDSIQFITEFFIPRRTLQVSVFTNVCPPTATTSIDGLACMALRFNGNNYRQGCNFRPIKRRLGRKDGRELSSCKLQHSFRCEPVDVCWPVSLSIVHHNNNNINITVQCTHGSRKQLLCAGRVPEMAGSVWRGSSSTT